MEPATHDQMAGERAPSRQVILGSFEASSAIADAAFVSNELEA